MHCTASARDTRVRHLRVDEAHVEASRDIKLCRDCGLTSAWGPASSAAGTPRARAAAADAATRPPVLERFPVGARVEVVTGGTARVGRVTGVRRGGAVMVALDAGVTVDAHPGTLRRSLAKYREGLAAVAAGAQRAAIDLLEAACVENPRDPRAYAVLAIIKLRMRRCGCCGRRGVFLGHSSLSEA